MFEAIKLLGTYTGGSFDVWQLAGPAKRVARAHIMSVLEGRKVPQSRAGVNAIRDRLQSLAGTTGECIAERDRHFREFCRGL